MSLWRLISKRANILSKIVFYLFELTFHRFDAVFGRAHLQKDGHAPAAQDEEAFAGKGERAPGRTREIHPHLEHRFCWRCAEQRGEAPVFQRDRRLQPRGPVHRDGLFAKKQQGHLGAEALGKQVRETGEHTHGQRSRVYSQNSAKLEQDKRGNPLKTVVGIRKICLLLNCPIFREGYTWT
jgi:hypothetical protein